ncbi:MAG TPA: UPF0149 family protein [Burkholderiaceae bacterium]|nr:UPF0149 family protein [Burkholderiaceae bacterium]
MLDGSAFDELDQILDDLRTREDETPQWEFCEGFMAALVCCRRSIPVDEYLPMLLGASASEEEAEDGDLADGGAFANVAQRQRFMQLWTQRLQEVKAALATEVETLDDERAYHPEVTDVRGAVAALSAEERADLEGELLPSFAQVWALGFMFAVENWPEEWAAPRDKDAAKWLDASLQAVVAMTEDDTDPPTLSPFSDDGPPSVSEARLNAFGEALWAVYDLHEIWRSIGPRVETVRKEATPGRNDPCWCGSGKKFKKCHGAG